MGTSDSSRADVAQRPRLRRRRSRYERRTGSAASLGRCCTQRSAVRPGDERRSRPRLSRSCRGRGRRRPRRGRAACRHARLLTVATPQEVAAIVVTLVRDLGGGLLPARLDLGGVALPLDVSLGLSEPKLAWAEPVSVGAMRLESVLPLFEGAATRPRRHATGSGAARQRRRKRHRSLARSQFRVPPQESTHVGVGRPDAPGASGATRAEGRSRSSADAVSPAGGTLPVSLVNA
jgi:hypothetical protein